MSQHELISVGCNEYSDAESFGGLSSAELDAKRVFETLTNPNCSEHDPQQSRLLLSPTLADVHEALRHVLFGGTAVETLTIYFAGHGVLKKESFFLCLKDSRYDALSATALSLSVSVVR